MIFFGASGHAKVVIEAWVASGGNVSLVIDDDHSIKNILGYPVINKYEPSALQGKEVCISIGSNSVRKRIAGLLPSIFKSVIHPSAILSTSSRIGDGSMVLGGVIVNSSAVVGRHVILNTGAIVEHDCRVEDFVHISPHVTLCGGVSVGEGTHVGAGATVIQNKKIGKWAVIGAGSVIIEDVPDFATVVGVPGKVIKSISNKL